ncbi:hypothetical protein SESBI_48815 [Sesbania bispinosa]|nr:hypothetical protein SESBI_48815 [Sesbania bispinosa]
MGMELLVLQQEDIEDKKIQRKRTLLLPVNEICRKPVYDVLKMIRMNGEATEQDTGHGVARKRRNGGAGHGERRCRLVYEIKG